MAGVVPAGGYKTDARNVLKGVFVKAAIFDFLRKDWEEYLEKVVPKSASSVQITETRRAFFAGAFTVVKIMQVIKRLNKGEQVEIAWLMNAQNECLQFCNQEVAEYIGVKADGE